ncbi:MAG: hypothetical protein EOO20_14440 [Chryseobacterium sp.]|nr:MAG: hypothetical protein EOO20_14440 [Chryseobacterium sp.]
MDINNLLSGFLGAVFALVLAEAWRLGLVAWERKKKRKIFVAYIKNVIKPGLRAYIKDTLALKTDIQTYPNHDTIYNHHKFDMLPSLNADIFKELGFNELYFLTKDFDLHEKVIDIYHCIDYLKATMPYESHQNFIDQCDAHFKEKGCKTVDDLIAHAKDCVTINDIKIVTDGNLNLRLDSAKSSLLSCETILERI